MANSTYWLSWTRPIQPVGRPPLQPPWNSESCWRHREAVRHTCVPRTSSRSAHVATSWWFLLLQKNNFDAIVKQQKQPDNSSNFDKSRPCGGYIITETTPPNPDTLAHTHSYTFSIFLIFDSEKKNNQRTSQSTLNPPLSQCGCGGAKKWKISISSPHHHHRAGKNIHKCDRFPGIRPFVPQQQKTCKCTEKHATFFFPIFLRRCCRFQLFFGFHFTRFQHSLPLLSASTRLRTQKT